MKDYENYILRSLEDTKSLANTIAQNFDKNQIILLKGDLGSGKTTLAKELIYIITGDDNVTSPTFNIVQIYENSEKIVYHYDLYRLRHKDEAYEIGLYDNLDQGISIIEWPEIIEDELNSLKTIIIELSENQDGIREARFLKKP